MELKPDVEPLREKAQNSWVGQCSYGRGSVSFQIEHCTVTVLVKHRGVTSFPQSVRRRSGVVKPRLYTLRRWGTDHEITTVNLFDRSMKKWWNARAVKAIHNLILNNSSFDQWNHKCTDRSQSCDHLSTQDGCHICHGNSCNKRVIASFIVDVCVNSSKWNPQMEAAQEVKIYPKIFLAFTTANINLEMCKSSFSPCFRSDFVIILSQALINWWRNKLRTTSVKVNGMYFVEMSKILLSNLFKHRNLPLFVGPELTTF